MFRVVFDEYRAMWSDIRGASTWGDKLRYLFMAPGWSHDGPDKRSNTLRRLEEGA